MGVKAKLVNALAFVVVIGLVFAVLQAPGPAFAAATRIHIVRPGESLSSIAAIYGVTVAAIQQENGIANPNFVYVGQRLRIPGNDVPGSAMSSVSTESNYRYTSGSTQTSAYRGTGSTYIVRRGDTLYKIARMFDVSVADIVRANNLRSYFIWVGERLVIPSGHVYPGVGSSTGPVGVVPSATARSRPSGSTGLGYVGPTFYYVVRPGDTLSGLALRFGTSVAAIKAANGLVSEWLYVGQRLKIPGSAIPKEPSVAPRPTPTRIHWKPTVPAKTQPTPVVAPSPTAVAPTATPVPIPKAKPAPVFVPTPTPTFDKPESPYELSGG